MLLESGIAICLNKSLDFAHFKIMNKEVCWRFHFF
jgi:hypothetical protein